MWSNAWMLVCLAIVTVTTEGHPYNDRKLHQNEVQVGPPHDRETKVQNDAKENSNGGLDSDKRHSAKSFKKVPVTPVVDDDLLEFLVRVADNPAEWNKIRRVLSMLGRDETGTTAAAADDRDAVTTTTTKTAAAAVTPTEAAEDPAAAAADVPSESAAVASPADGPLRHLHQPRAPPRAPPTTPVPRTLSSAAGPASSRASWPPAEWIRQTADRMEAARGGDVAYYDEDDGDDDGGDGDGDGDGPPYGADDGELELLDGAPDVLSPPPASRRRGGPVPATPPCRSPDDDGCAGGGGGAYVNVVESAAPGDRDDGTELGGGGGVAAACCAPSAPSRPAPRRATGGHMSRYQFKRIDGGPDDGSGVNGTYVAVVEDDNGPPR